MNTGELVSKFMQLVSRVCDFMQHAAFSPYGRLKEWIALMGVREIFQSREWGLVGKGYFRL